MSIVFKMPHGLNSHHSAIKTPTVIRITEPSKFISKLSIANCLKAQLGATAKKCDIPEINIIDMQYYNCKSDATIVSDCFIHLSAFKH